MKALLYARGEKVIGHSVAELYKRAIEHDRGLEEFKNVSGLDKYYIPTRYPNGLPGGVPYEAFDEVDATRAIELASEVVESIRARLDEMKG